MRSSWLKNRQKQKQKNRKKIEWKFLKEIPLNLYGVKKYC